MSNVYDIIHNKELSQALMPVAAGGGESIATNQVSVAESATQIVAARPGRRAVLIVNHGTTDVYVGTSAVTTSTGALLVGTKGAALSIPTMGAVYGIVSAGSATVSYVEVYDS